MSLQVNGLNTVQAYSKPQMNTTFKVNPGATTSTLERTPTTDTLVKPTQNKTKKTLLTIGAIVLAGVGIFTAIKAGKAHQQKKAIQEIEKKFADLQNDMPRVQKTFKEVFLREDLTEKEALEMLNRYKEVEKLGITGKKEDYIKAVFKEAKRNFGFEEAKFPLIIEQNSRSIMVKGGANIYNKHVEISPQQAIKEIQNKVHHEMRHIKQHFLAANYDEKTFRQSLMNHNSSLTEGLTEKELKEVLDDTILEMKNIHGVTSFSINNIPKNQLDYARKCSEAFSKPYIDGTKDFAKYEAQWQEVDARFAGESIAKLFGLMTK